MRGVTHENYEKVRPVFKLYKETIFDPLKVEKDRETELCEIILQEMEVFGTCSTQLLVTSRKCVFRLFIKAC